MADLVRLIVGLLLLIRATAAGLTTPGLCILIAVAVRTMGRFAAFLASLPALRLLIRPGTLARLFLIHLYKGVWGTSPPSISKLANII